MISDTGKQKRRLFKGVGMATLIVGFVSMGAISASAQSSSGDSSSGNGAIDSQC